MKAPKEIKQWINNCRSRYGRKNGCIPRWVWDYPELERKLDKSNKQRSRKGKETPSNDTRD